MIRIVATLIVHICTTHYGTVTFVGPMMNSLFNQRELMPAFWNGIQSTVRIVVVSTQERIVWAPKLNAINLCSFCLCSLDVVVLNRLVIGCHSHHRRAAHQWQLFENGQCIQSWMQQSDERSFRYIHNHYMHNHCANQHFLCEYLWHPSKYMFQFDVLSCVLFYSAVVSEVLLLKALGPHATWQALVDK